MPRPAALHRAGRGRRLLPRQASEGYAICYGDIGVPVFARIGGADLIVGIVVESMLVRELPGDACGSEIRVIDATTILEFVQSIATSKRR